MGTLYRTFKDKLYPGGEVNLMNIELNEPAGKKLTEQFKNYSTRLNISQSNKVTTLYQVASELNMDFENKLKFVSLEEEKKEPYLLHLLNYQHQLLVQAEKSKDVFHLN
jgi:hypothetical protein